MTPTERSLERVLSEPELFERVEQAVDTLPTAEETDFFGLRDRVSQETGYRDGVPLELYVPALVRLAEADRLTFRLDLDASPAELCISKRGDPQSPKSHSHPSSQA